MNNMTWEEFWYVVVFLFAFLYEMAHPDPNFDPLDWVHTGGMILWNLL